MAIDSRPHLQSESEFRELPPDGRDSLAVYLRTLSFGLFLALLLAVTVSVVLFQHPELGDGGLTRNLLTAGVVLMFLLPLAALYGWVRLRLRAVERLAESARLIAAGEYHMEIPTAALPAEGAELARALEELRGTLLRQREMIAEQQHLTSEILSGLGEGLLAINRDKRVVLVNRRLSELFRLGEGVEGKPFLEVLRIAPLLGAFDAALRGEESHERIGVEIGGAVRQIELRVFPLKGSHDIAAAALFIDVTRLEQLERVRRDFVADFSHEVRTPLAGIRSAVETLERGGLEPSQHDHLLKIVSRQLARLEALAHEVGELKQIETGEIHLERRETDLLQLVRSLCEEFASRPAGSGLKFSVGGQPAVAFVDPQRIEQVFTNLIDNAVKYGSRGSEVHVEVADEREEAVIRVTDFGEGIPESEQERIFHRFYRLDRSRTAEGTGRGLGLAIAKHVVLLHGGLIRVESLPGKGATFEVRLPKGAS